MLCIGTDDLNRLTGFQWHAERCQLAINLGVATAVADVGVHQVCKIYRCRTNRQAKDVALGREDEYLVRKQINLNVLIELKIVVAGLTHINQICQPLMRTLLSAVGLPFLIHPVRGDTGFSKRIHFFGSDLHFDWNGSGAEQNRVQRLIAVALGYSDIVFELPWQRIVQSVHYTERAITLINGRYDYPYRKHVEHIFKSRVLVAHLLVQAVQMLFAAMHGCPDTRIFEPGNSHDFKLSYQLKAVGIAVANSLSQHPVPRRIQRTEPEVFEFVFHFVDAKPIGNGRVDFECFPRNATTLVVGHRTQCAHVVNAVCELYQDDSDVIDHRKQHLLEIGRLCLCARLEFKVCQFAEAVDNGRHVVAKSCGDF